MVAALIRGLAEAGSALGTAPTVEPAGPSGLGPFLLLTGLAILPGFAGRQTDVGDRAAAGHEPGFRVGAQVTDQNDFIDASRHGCSLPLSVTAYNGTSLND